MEIFEIENDCLVKCNITNEIAHVVSKNIKKIGPKAFSYCHQLERLYLPWYVEEVPESNFIDIQGPFVEPLQAPGFTIFGEKGTEAERVANQAKVIFLECKEIIKGNKYCCYLGKKDKVDIPNNIDYIGMAAFSNTPYVKEIVLPKSLKIIDKHAFACTKIAKIVIPASVNALDSYIFENCKNLTEVVFENGETKLDNDCFVGCSDELVIKAPSGGFVEDYANRYNIKFEAKE